MFAVMIQPIQDFPLPRLLQVLKIDFRASVVAALIVHPFMSFNCSFVAHLKRDFRASVVAALTVRRSMSFTCRFGAHLKRDILTVAS